MIKIVGKKSFDTPPNDYYIILEYCGIGVWLDWPGIYSTAQEARKAILQRGSAFFTDYIATKLIEGYTL